MRRPPLNPLNPRTRSPSFANNQERHAPWTTPDPEPIHHFLFDTARITLYNK